MKLHSDSYELDRWWFAPLLYAVAAVAITVFIFA
jgi:hypothetical protein